LRAQAEWLNAYGYVTVTIEGHADERGTREYNLALGERRAVAVRNYLVALGVSPSRINIISYGKERPVSFCSNESCWSQNRRGVMVLN
jgi:peptidoglycan-associated lipoprotein